MLLSRNFCQKKGESHFHTVQHTTQCGKYGNLLSRIFGKYFVKVTVLLKKSPNSWFDEIFFSESKFSFSRTVHHVQLLWKTEKFIKKMILWNHLFHKTVTFTLPTLIFHDPIVTLLILFLWNFLYRKSLNLSIRRDYQSTLFPILESWAY